MYIIFEKNYILFEIIKNLDNCIINVIVKRMIVNNIIKK